MFNVTTDRAVFISTISLFAFYSIPLLYVPFFSFYDLWINQIFASFYFPHVNIGYTFSQYSYSDYLDNFLF